MTGLPLYEPYALAVVPETAIQNAAAARDISLEPDRLARLIECVGPLHAVPPDAEGYSTGKFWDLPNGLEVGYAGHSDDFEGSAAKVDFTPVYEGEGDFISGSPTARAEHATEATLRLIHGAQNYALLVDAGIIKKPDVLFGETNPQMAVVAERFGMLSDAARRNSSDTEAAHRQLRQSHGKVAVSGRYDEVSDRIFSDATQQLERVLTRRLAAQKSGSLALK